MLSDLRYEFIRTPLEQPLVRLRHALGFLRRHLHPELREIHLEEGRMQAVIVQLLRPDSNCIDVGCHYGSILSIFCRRAPSGRHLAFEAIPEKVRFLRRKFPDVDVREVALLDRAGTVPFFARRRRTGFSSLARPTEGAFERLQVRCARLDDVVPRDRRFDFFKADVEGAELYVLRGATELLARDRPMLLFECGPGGPQAFGHEPGDVFDLISVHSSYSVFFLKGLLRGDSPVDRATFVEASSVYPFKAFNWVAVPAERVLEVFGRSAAAPSS